MGRTSDLISIIIPVYNAEKYLVRCINSVLAQTYLNLQIILIDDGSTDHSFDICQDFEQKDTRIEIYHTENRGSVAARKLGLKISKGSYIGFVDADDYVEPEMFYELLQIIIDSDFDFVHSGYIEESPTKQEVVCRFEDKIIETRTTEDKAEFLRKYIFEGNEGRSISPSLWSKLFKAEFIKRCFGDLPDQQQYGEDFICLCKCILESHHFILYKKAWYHYIVNENSLSHMGYYHNMIKEIHLWHYLLDMLEEYQYIDILETSINYFQKKRMMALIIRDGCWKKNIIRFYFKDIEQIIGKKIVIFGAGEVGKDYYAQISKYQKCNIVAWSDSNWDKCTNEYFDLVDIKDVDSSSYDLIIIAVRNRQTATEIESFLMDNGVDSKKIIWREPGKNF